MGYSTDPSNDVLKHFETYLTQYIDKSNKKYDKILNSIVYVVYGWFKIFVFFQSF